MKQHSRLKKLLTFSLITLLAMPGLTGKAQALRDLKPNLATLKAQPPKVAPDLAELLTLDDEEAKAGKNGARTLAEKRREKLKRTVINNLALPSEAVTAEEKQSFIVQMSDTTSLTSLKARLAAAGGAVRHTHGGLGLVMIEAPRTTIRQLAADHTVAYVSPDRPMEAMGHVENTTGATQIRTAIAGVSSVDGTGVTVAVIDSGVADPHMAFTYWNSLDKDFTNSGTDDDHFGHGTHVASLIAGNPNIWSGSYEGVAPEARIINLRVLNQYGQGAASQTIAALDWCVTNKATHNIKVINLSLGTMAKDSYKNDPLCLAARRAHNAGIVVVAAAGNDGRTLLGQKIYGGIHSPGIDPSVITVGATNTFGTDARSDDVVTTYSSRGPTRGYYVNSAGKRVYDDLIKPDLVAPGNQLIAAASGDNARGSNTLLELLPLLKASDNGDVSYRMMYLSGTSMSAPLVAGTVALMLEANPSLTPSLVKTILMFSAQPLKGFNMFEQGAGQLNVDGAVRLAKLVKTKLPSSVGSSLLTAALPTQQSTISGTTFKWSLGVITNWGFLYGGDLLKLWQDVYGNGAVLADATAVSSSTFIKVSGKTTSGILLKSGAVRIDSSGVMLSDGVVVSDGVMLSDGVILADGAVLADGVVVSDGVILSDGHTRNASTFRAASMALGDNTARMSPAQ